jgi:hypothetical protein
MQQYAFSNTIVLVNGVEITGWADGDDVINVKRRVDSISDKVGAGGNMAISISSDKSGEFTFKLQQVSISNSYLQSLMDSQELGGPTFVPIKVTFQDIYRNDLAIGSFGYLKKPADLTRGAAINNQEWGIVVENLKQVLGANPL